MQRFILQAALFLLAWLAIGYTVDGALYLQMLDKRAHVHEDWPDLMALDCDYWVVGDSRTTGHLIPAVIDSVTGMSGHNIAYSGYRMRMGLDRLRFALEHAKTKPKWVLLQSDLSYLAESRIQDNYPMKDGVLRYFLFDQLGINAFYRRYDNWRELDAWLPLLRYKGYPLIFAKHALGWNRWDKRGTRGYWRLERGVGFTASATKTGLEDSLLIFDLLELQEENEFHLLGFIPPSPGARWQPTPDNRSKLNALFPIVDHTGLFANAEEAYFHDRSHFSEKGAIEYSLLIGEAFIKRQTHIE